jgi:hypothetical protein
MEDQQKLKELRDTVLQELTPILVNSDMAPEDKFTLQLSAAEASGKIERFKEALESARHFEDDTNKANAYLDLLEAIDIQIGDTAVEEAQPAQPSESTNQANTPPLDANRQN